jgi:hypothetical protein
VGFGRNCNKLYWSIIRPTVTYGCETWVLVGIVTAAATTEEVNDGSDNNGSNNNNNRS